MSSFLTSFLPPVNTPSGRRSNKLLTTRQTSLVTGRSSSYKNLCRGSNGSLLSLSGHSISGDSPIATASNALDKDEELAWSPALSEHSGSIYLSDISATDLEPEVFEQLGSADFDVLRIGNPNHLVQVAHRIFLHYIDFSDALPISTIKLMDFIQIVSRNYRPNPFHNFQHAVAVLQSLYVMLLRADMKARIANPMLFAYLLSALTHDLDHTGRTNLFEINSFSELAQLYNDQSVLENHHAAATFRLLNLPVIDLFGKLEFREKKEIRAVIISNILATDMSNHSRLLSEANDNSDRISRNDPLDFPDVLLLGKLLLHAADLSGPTKELSIAKEWSSRVTAEFNSQYALEVELGLPALPFMAACDELTFLKNEIRFSGFFVGPLWRQVAQLFPALEYGHNQLEKNIDEYQKMITRLEERLFAAETA